MTDRTQDDLNAKVRATVDDGIAELVLLGLPSRDHAAALMAIQAMIRIRDPQQVESVMRFAADLDEPQD